MEKKETKRYSIVEYNGFVIRKVNNIEEYNELVKFIKKENNKTKNKYFFGNLSTEEIDGKLLVKIHIYNKLTPKKTISEIDNETTNYISIKHMLDSGYRNLTRHYNPDVYIVYFEELNKTEKEKQKASDRLDIRIKALPLLFECDKKYFSENYIRQAIDCFAKARNMDFFKDILEKYSKYKKANILLDELRIKIDKVERVMKDFYSKGEVDRTEFDKACVLENWCGLSSISKNLYRKICVEQGKNGRTLKDEEGNKIYSHRRVRDFGVFVREYVMDQTKRISATKYNVKQDPRNIGSSPTEEEMIVKISR